MKRPCTLRAVCLTILLGIGCWLGSSAWMIHQRSQPIRFAEPVPQVDWATFEPVRLAASDGIHTAAWFHPGEPDKPVLAIFHELGGGRGTALPAARIAAESGCGFLTVTLRAHGESEGNIIDYGWSAQYDVIAAVAWIRHHHPGRPVLLRGCSMGASAAVYAAPKLAESVDGYFLECLYADLSTALWNRADNRFPPVLREIAWAGLRTTAPWIMGDPKDIAPVQAIAKIPAHAPVWIVYGEHDALARPHESIALHAARTTGPAFLHAVPAGHARLYHDAPEQMSVLLRDFLVATEREVDRGTADLTTP